ncbi:hypothetical protein [Motiliproteus coralliicola]|uniref:hypothetical protein n=1 Tax=Motiliproteus coralliicola TaxID=2283196 RepID=UPI0010588CF2|nr:hypothetical protein [Motiliproteus coralliicola]
MRYTAKPSFADDPMPENWNGDLARLVDMLTYVRPAGSRGEQAFIDKYLRDIPNICEDAYGNFFLVIDSPNNEGITTMFTSHTDTCHFDPMSLTQFSMHFDQAIEEPLIKQELKYDASKQTLWKDDHDCLGADDGTGIWIMLNMIEAGIPGAYAFFREEEIGRKGSIWFAEMHKDQLEGTAIKHCVSFDRKGCSDIVSSQKGQPCCSKAFGDALAKQLNQSPSLNYKAGALGSYTDSASFMEIFPECTNIAVGYLNQHTSRETQNLRHAQQLLDQLLKVDWASLPAERDPKAIPPRPAYQGGYQGYGGHNSFYGNDPFDYDSTALTAAEDDDLLFDSDDSAEDRLDELNSIMGLIGDHPRGIAEWLITQGFTASIIKHELEDYELLELDIPSTEANDVDS